jgi:hypothetical protein
MDAPAPFPLSSPGPQGRAGDLATPVDTSRRIEIVRVADPTEERAVLERLALCPAAPAAAPVPAALVDRLRRLAGDFGYAAGIVEARDFLVRDCPSGPRPSAATGLVVVALPLVDEDLIALAEHFSRRPAIRDVERDPPVPAAGEAVLVLLDRDSPADATWRAFASLEARGIPFAVVPADKGPGGRLSLLKAQLFPAVEAAHVDRSDALLAEPWAAGMPGILTVSGHGNAIDLGGGDLVICPRGGDASADVAGLYPCFGDGRCFRQPLFGRTPESVERLIDPARFRHAVVLLLGCATFAFGDAPFARRGTILWRMAESDALAAVATIGVFYHDPNVETALLALLLEGHALGEAVRRFNAWHREAYGRTSPAPEGFGPLVAVGNPAFRLDRAGTFPGARAGIVKVEGGTEGLLLSTAPSGTAAGVRIAGTRGSEIATYISVRSPPGVAAAPSFELQPFDRQACIADREILRDSLPNLALWRLLLGDAGAPLAGALGEEGARIVADVDVLGTERLLREYLGTNAFVSDALVPTLSTLAVHRRVLEQWRLCQAAMLDAAGLWVRGTGGFLFHLWQQYYARDTGAAAQPCPACGRATEWLLHRGPADPADRHHLVHCPACGVLGQLPGGVTVSSDRSLGPCRGGDTLLLDFEVATDRSATLQGEFLLVRESWFRTTDDVARSGAVAIAPGARRTLSFALPVARGLAPGLYPLTLLGVVNGGLVQIRRHVSILERHACA